MCIPNRWLRKRLIGGYDTYIRQSRSWAIGWLIWPINMSGITQPRDLSADKSVLNRRLQKDQQAAAAPTFHHSQPWPRDPGKSSLVFALFSSIFAENTNLLSKSFLVVYRRMQKGHQAAAQVAVAPTSPIQVIPCMFGLFSSIFENGNKPPVKFIAGSLQAAAKMPLGGCILYNTYKLLYRWLRTFISMISETVTNLLSKSLLVVYRWLQKSHQAAAYFTTLKLSYRWLRTYISMISEYQVPHAPHGR